MQDFKNTIFNKKVARCVLFFVILIALFFLVSGKIVKLSGESGNVVNDRNKNLVEIAREPKNTIDLLVVGDSLTYTSVSPLQLWKNTGITSYICGQPGQRIQETYNVLETALKTQKPKMIIIETNVLFRKQTGLKRVKSEIIRLAENKFPAFRFHDVWKSQIIGRQYSPKQYKGFSIRSRIQSYSGRPYMMRSPREAEMSPAVNDYMGKIIKMCRKNNIELMLLATPSPKNNNYMKHNTLKKFAAQNRIKYLNMNFHVDTIGINWEKDSLDNGDHLNLSGAIKVTDFLCTYFQNNTRLPDYRKNPSYEKWNKEAKVYEAKVSQRLKAMDLKY